ncbi:MAG: helix-turn-helix domain-containing protein [Chloroflexota bacterium]
MRSASLKALRSRTHRTVCAVLVEARKGSGLSQHELARRLRRSQSFVAKIEVGERRIDVVEFIEIARALGCDPRELLERALK